tara:strand:+ start:86 stop:349 length:264 start_codon:yes stop_codon:yes gene_type:complete
MATEKQKEEYQKHTEILTYRPTAREITRGSARHASKFSNDAEIVRDNQEKFEALVRLSNHVSDLEERLVSAERKILELSQSEPPKKK